MNLSVFSQAELLKKSAADGAPALLLEGGWDSSHRSSGLPRWDLDHLIDVGCSWVDDEAVRLAEQLAFEKDASEIGEKPITLAYVNTLALSYYLVKLLRPVALYEQGLPPTAYRKAELHAVSGRDEDYAHVLEQLWRLHGVEGRVQWHPGSGQAAPAMAPNAPWRQAASLIHRVTAPAAGSQDDDRPRVVLCGNPRILDPVCEELLTRGCRVWWIYDRFAVRSWLRWRRRGVGQLVCDSSRGDENRLPLTSWQRNAIRKPLWSRGVDLAPAVDAWLSRMAATNGAAQTRFLEQVTAHFNRVAPTHVVLDEDVTPLARCTVAAARRVSAVSTVVQNAATGVRFGFAPLVADQVCAWGESSRRQYERWGVDRSRIKVTGSSWHDALVNQLKSSPITSRRGDRPHVVVFTTPPARDHRPDMVSYHKTSRTYRQMIEWVCGTLENLPHVRTTFKLHPRQSGRDYIESIVSAFPKVQAKMIEKTPLGDVLKDARCVISLGSSVGVEAALAGVPVVQVLPEGSGNYLPASQWGMFGTARSQAELDGLLQQILSHPATVPSQEVFANVNGTASSSVVDSVLKASVEPREHEHLLPIGSYRIASNRRVA